MSDASVSASGVELSSRQFSGDAKEHIVLNATFEARVAENAQDTTQADADIQSAFFRSDQNAFTVDPKRIAPRSSGQMMQDERLLSHQSLFRDRVFSDSGKFSTSPGQQLCLEPAFSSANGTRAGPGCGRPYTHI